MMTNAMGAVYVHAIVNRPALIPRQKLSIIVDALHALIVLKHVKPKQCDTDLLDQKKRNRYNK